MNCIDELKQRDELIDKITIRALIWRRWIELYQKNVKIEKYFLKRGVKRIAIYGMAELGIALCQELISSEVEVAYGLDMHRRKCEIDVEIRPADQIDDDVDMIVVTAVTYFSEIADTLNLRLNRKIPIVGIDEVIIELLLEE